MAAPDLSLIVRAAVRMCINPTDLSAAWPHGGTELGALRGVYAEPGIQHEDIVAEEWGVEVVESVYLGQSWVIGVLLRQPDDDLYTTMFPATAVGASSGDRILTQEADDSHRAGSLASAKAVKVLLAPRDLRAGSNAQYVLFHRALPMVEQSARLRFALQSELAVPALFRAIRATDGRTYQVGKLEDLELVAP